MGIKYIEHKNGTSTPDKVAVEYAVKDSAGNVIKDTYYLATNPSGYTTNTGTVTSVAASGSGGISISGSPITTSGTLAIGLNLSTAINGLGEGTSPAQRNDYIIAQYAGGGTTNTNYYRRKLSNIFAALAASDIPTLTSAKISDFDGAVDTALGINTSSGDTTKFLNAKGAWAVPYTHPAYTSATAAAVKVGRDATGHVVIGNALTAADVGASASSHQHYWANVQTAASSNTNTDPTFRYGTMSEVRLRESASSTTVKATIVYNATTAAIDFNFA